MTWGLDMRLGMVINSARGRHREEMKGGVEFERLIKIQNHFQPMRIPNMKYPTSYLCLCSVESPIWNIPNMKYPTYENPQYEIFKKISHWFFSHRYKILPSYCTTLLYNKDVHLKGFLRIRGCRSTRLNHVTLVFSMFLFYFSSFTSILVYKTWYSALLIYLT